MLEKLARKARKAEPKVEPKVKPGTVALIAKGGDRVPVQLKDDAHLEKLIEAHGAGNVEVRS